ncbi:PIN domain nuclease of toxin-antitoxin system [Algoriphagus sp. 4150]|nr:PIN domain nuclease of toxin-antitoxin system [Algoriphagus sp. 4150]
MIAFKILFIVVSVVLYFSLAWKYGQTKLAGEEKKARYIKLVLTLLVITLIIVASILFA